MAYDFYGILVLVILLGGCIVLFAGMISYFWRKAKVNLDHTDGEQIDYIGLVSVNKRAAFAIDCLSRDLDYFEDYCRLAEDPISSGEYGMLKTLLYVQMFRAFKSGTLQSDFEDIKAEVEAERVKDEV